MVSFSRFCDLFSEMLLHHHTLNVEYSAATLSFYVWRNNLALPPDFATEM